MGAGLSQAPRYTAHSAKLRLSWLRDFWTKRGWRFTRDANACTCDDADVTAMGLIVLPSMSYDFGLGRFQQLRIKARFTALILTAIALAYTACLFALARPVEHILYGEKYAQFSGLIPMFALIPVCTGFATGYSMALRASQKPHFDLVSNGAAAPVGIMTCVIFLHLWGIRGGVASMVLSFATYALVFFWSYRVWASSGTKKAQSVTTG